MKLKLFNSITIFALIWAVSSCGDKFLDMPPQDQVVDGNFYKTSEQVLAATAPLYNLVWFDYNDKASHGIGDGRGGVLYSGSYQNVNIEMKTTGLTHENISAWQAFYNVVGQSNTLIQNVEKYSDEAVSENVKKHAIAEGRFMRAIAYYHLVSNYGAIPIIIDNTRVLGDTTIARNTIESVYQLIIKDLNYAAENLPTTPILKGRITKYAAQGMLSKIYLTRAGVRHEGTNRNQSDLDSAALLAKNVIDNVPPLLPSYEDLFKTANNNNQETLFALQWVYNGSYGTANSVQAFLAFNNSITGANDGWGQDLGASKFQLDLYEPNDQRRKATFMYPGDHYSYIHQSIEDPDNPGKFKIVELTVPIDDKSNISKGNGRAWVKKYVVGRPEDNNGKVTSQATEMNTYMLRTGELYLIYAEAVLGNNESLSGGNGLAYFNKVRERAGAAPKTSITWDDILKERHLELAVEGKVWYDYVRLHYFNPQKAYDLLSQQERGSFRVVPDQWPNPVSWTIVQEPNQSRKINVGSGNFYLPIPTNEVAGAPNLNKEPIPFDFSKLK
jgi:starch-binding outer membrane protein, SusD/RagB family